MQHTLARAAIFAALVVTTVAAACGGEPAAKVTQTPGPARAPVLAPTPTQTWSASGDGIDAVFATPDLAPGKQRVAFVLSDDRGLVRLPAVQVSSYRYAGGSGAGTREGPVQTVTARFYEFPLGTRGIYVTGLDFAGPGDWAVEADVPRPDGRTSKVEIRFPVGERTRSVAVGEQPPPSRNKTLKDVLSIAQLTTGTHRDPELYQTTIAEAAKSGKPTVVVFASPAFCTNAVCGPQVEVLSEIRQRYGGKANFIHVDYYDNPHEVQGDLDKAVLSPVLAEWGLDSKEWTFVIGRDGVVSARFENFAPAEEIIAALDAALGQG